MFGSSATSLPVSSGITSIEQLRILSSSPFRRVDQNTDPTEVIVKPHIPEQKFEGMDGTTLVEAINCTENLRRKLSLCLHISLLLPVTIDKIDPMTGRNEKAFIRVFGSIVDIAKHEIGYIVWKVDDTFPPQTKKIYIRAPRSLCDLDIVDAQDYESKQLRGESYFPDDARPPSSELPFSPSHHTRPSSDAIWRSDPIDFSSSPPATPSHDARHSSDGMWRSDPMDFSSSPPATASHDPRYPSDPIWRGDPMELSSFPPPTPSLTNSPFSSSSSLDGDRTHDNFWRRVKRIFSLPFLRSRVQSQTAISYSPPVASRSHWALRAMPRAFTASRRRGH
ncbi:hypothetical protein K474DRAFT_1706819 [Panus rudis PR-1116 ss-1]|nr:hypothetical protein K474DRAFT_1706819 [Panus rudis PR-1116 ss-1]